jgi:hypothetical protein
MAQVTFGAVRAAFHAGISFVKPLAALLLFLVHQHPTYFFTGSLCTNKKKGKNKK